MKQTVKKHLINLRGSRINKKIVVFESDDWGSIRIPNDTIKQELLEEGLIRSKDAFSKFDTLETSDDFTSLFDVLKSFKDKNGNNPVITANIILNNPDFNTIKETNFEEYHSEPFYKTYLSYPGSENAFETLKSGINQNLITPQFHGKEHLNVVRWMDFLKAGDQRYHFAFERGCFSIDEKSAQNRRGNLMAAYDYENDSELDYVKRSIREGLKQFEEIFGIKSKTTVAPCYVWDEHVEKTFLAENVQGLQSSYQQNIPSPGAAFKKRYPYSGQKNKLGQLYFVRNSLFEPSINANIDWVEKCMESIAIAFKWGKPAIIGTHRINFCGRLDINQRNKNLEDLKLLLTKMLKKWPEIEFMDSPTISDFYNANQ
ncbi:hypothetical protein [Brumimicrobium mesophilum]|uniref:hypothetical protein n=1 Tax=Brumimicrobium mesophilum TaxID=392717 RepID=UPI000D14326D|nr:hypothetical protein [Brumimicrobium mesophilum]